MNFSNRNFTFEDLRDCTLIMKNGTKIPVTIDYIETTADTFPKFEGHVTGPSRVSYRNLYDIRNDDEVSRNIYRNILNSTYGIGSLRIPEIKNVIFNDPATIVFWEDGTKTVVKCQDGDKFDPEKGLAMAIAKKAYGNKGGYCNKMKKWLPKEEPVDTNRSIFVPKEFTFNVDIDKLSKSFMKGIRDGIDSIFNGTRCTSNDNDASSKKRMTFREEVAKLHPEDLIPDCKGGVCGCPRDLDRCPYHFPSEDDCRACWDREIPDELMNND